MDLYPIAFFSIGGYEWLIVLFLALLLFGRRLPQVMRGLGSSAREFREGIQEADPRRDLERLADAKGDGKG